DFTRLSDLEVVGGVAGIDRSARGADACAELVGEGEDVLVELFGRGEGAAAGDDALGRGEFGAIRLRDLFRDEGGLERAGGRGGGFDGSRTGGGDGLEGGAADGDDLLRVGRFDREDRVAGVDRTLEGRAIDHLGDLRDLRHVELGGDARGDVLAGGG